MKYNYKVYNDIEEYYRENGFGEITHEDIDRLDPSVVLGYWLEWNGIFGYTETILEILHYDDIKHASRNIAEALAKLGEAL